MEKTVDYKEIDKVVAKYLGKPGALLSILEESQMLNKFKYLSEDVMQYVSKKTKVPLSQVYSVATFYAFFNLKPQGEHSVVICRGTACHTRGSLELLEQTGMFLGFDESFNEGEGSYTTKDNKVTIKTVACFGQCAMAPVVSVDNLIYGSMTVNRLKKIIKTLEKGTRK